jgi:hypothetical protein
MLDGEAIYIYIYIRGDFGLEARRALGSGTLATRSQRDWSVMVGGDLWKRRLVLQPVR